MNKSESMPGIPRRKFLRNTALGAAVLAVIPILGCRNYGLHARRSKGPASRKILLSQDWLFGGKFQAAALEPGFDDSAFARVSLPHCVNDLSWHDWQATDWQAEWIYRRHFSVPAEMAGQRVFLHFAGVMSAARPAINGQALPDHVGGYLPFDYEITDWVRDGDNVLAVAIDARWQNAPPEGSAKGIISVDFFEPGGIPRDVTLQVVPPVFIKDVFAKPVNVLAPGRQLEVTATLDAALLPDKPLQIKVELFDGQRKISGTSQPVSLTQTGVMECQVTLSDLAGIKLWDVDAPALYDVVTTLVYDETPWHDCRTRIGFREARFELDGFYLNGRRLQIFGLNRHEVYPYTGFAMPDRVTRYDAKMLREELNCNMVRCSHYPQTDAFLDACDELGLLVWEEIPGWGYLGNDAWKEIVARNVADMVRRDRNRASVIIWGVRINESKNDPELYKRTRDIAKSLDDTRPTSGAMVGGIYSTKNWFQDVYAYNDYNRAPGDYSVDLKPPLPGVPFLVTEAVGQIIGPPKADRKYRRVGDPFLQEKQAIYHAQVHDQAAVNQRYAGVVAWCAFEYGSPLNSLHGIKNPGVADVFRIPKLGASFYKSQISPAVRPVIEPNFYWDFGDKTPNGPGQNTALFSNCDRLEIFLDGQPHATVLPDRVKFPHLKYPPFFADLSVVGAGHPELRVEGYVGGQKVLSRSFSADPARDQFYLQLDDQELIADGRDATRLVFGRVDKFGAMRPFTGGTVSFELDGPGVVVGDNPFALTDAGGMGAVWIKAAASGHGQVKVVARHSDLGEKTVTLKVVKAEAEV